MNHVIGWTVSADSLSHSQNKVCECVNSHNMTQICQLIEVTEAFNVSNNYDTWNILKDAGAACRLGVALVCCKTHTS